MSGDTPDPLVSISGNSPDRELSLPRAVAWAVAELTGAGVDSPRVDAEILAAHVLGVPRTRLAGAADLSPAALARYRTLVAARARRTPVQYLTGSAGFRYLDLAVGPGVFVPRPETEALVDWALSALRAAGGPALVVDLCAGSGAIALSVAHEYPAATALAVERSPAALRWLRENAARRVAAGDPAIEVRAGDVTDLTVTADLRGRVDLVLCNPPYVPAGTPVPAEVAGYDPTTAVFAGPDGLAVLRPVIALAADLLRPGGGLAVEHDDTHGVVVPDLLRADGRYTAVSAHRDLAGRPRFATARLADCNRPDPGGMS